MDRNENLISVIIPCYNHGQYINETLDSITKQTFRNFEIIIVDDGSDDTETIEILNRIDLPNTVVHRKKNGGPSSARNYGIEKSSGKYILTLDSDDKFAPEFTEKALGILKSKPDVGMVTSYLIRFTSKGISGKGHPKGGDVTDFINKNNCHASLLFRYQCWEEAGGYDEEIPGFEDWDFALGVTKKGWLVHSIPEYLSYYRDIDGSGFDLHQMNRPNIIKYMVKKHIDLYQKNIVDVIYSKELELKKLRESVNMYKNSFSLNVGNFILLPVRWFKKIQSLF